MKTAQSFIFLVVVLGMQIMSLILISVYCHSRIYQTGALLWDDGEVDDRPKVFR